MNNTSTVRANGRSPQQRLVTPHLAVSTQKRHRNPHLAVSTKKTPDRAYIGASLRRLVLTGLFFLTAFTLSAQTDSRYDSGKNLPFNQKAGDVDPQTGNVTIQVTDLSLPGRAGMDFSFGRIWKTNQSNVFSMSRNPVDGSNRLTSDTIEDINNMGVGWSSNLPYVLTDDNSGRRVVTLFFGGGAYEIDQTGVVSRNLQKSNLLGYDLVDKRIYEDSSRAYGDGPVSADSLAAYSVADLDTDRSRYELLLKDNSRYIFREDGKLMVQIDKSGLNEIWYYYDNLSRLATVVDTVGRIIRFFYDVHSNLERIEWDVDSHEIAGNGSRISSTETRSINYSYTNGEDYPEISSLSGLVTDYKTPYALQSVTDVMGNVTNYEYSADKTSFSFESNLSHWQNVYLLLNTVNNYVDESDISLSERHFEYDIPGDGMYTRYFYNGYMEFYKVSREFAVDRSGREMGEKKYIYHENNEAGNFNQYTAIVQAAGVKQTYAYSISTDPARNDVLDTLTTETNDGYMELKDFVYTRNRVKTLEETFRQGQFVYDEKFLYDLKGNLKDYTDLMGLKTVKQYDDTYSIPVYETRIFQSAGEDKEYESERVLTGLGQVEKEIIYIDENGKTKGLSTVYKYDAYGNVIEVTDPGNIKTHILYDSETRSFPVRSYQAVNEEFYSSAADPNYWFEKPDVILEVNLNSWKVFNSDGSVWLEVDGSGFAVEHYYDRLGAEITTIFPDENDILLSGTEVDDITTHTDFAAFLTGRLYNPGVRIDIEYENAFVKTYTDFEYDNMDNSWSTLVTADQQDGIGNTEQEISYGENGQIHGVKEMEYDLYGRMIALTDPDAGADYSNLSVNNVQVRRFDKTWLVKYDDLGRTIKVLYPDTGLGTKIKNISYNDSENSVTTIDPEGSTIYEKMDWSGNVISQIAYGNSSTDSTGVQIYKYEYDQLNRMTKSTDPEGLVTGYRFDERNLLIRQIYGEDSDFLVYNDRGLLTSKTDRKGQMITFVYDEAGRNTETNYLNAGASVSDTEYRMYDHRGNVTRVEKNSLIEQCEFDGAGRLSGLNRRIKDILQRNKLTSVYSGTVADQTFSFQYDYTASGLLNEMEYPDGSVHNFTYDQYLGQLATIGEGINELSISPFVTNLDYNKSGVVTRMDYSNRTTQEWDFDNRKRISRIRIGKTATPEDLIEDLNYTINGAGNITGINENTYSYDGFHRIAGAVTKLPDVADFRKVVDDHFGTYEGGTPVEGNLYNAEADLFPAETPDGRINGEDYLQALVRLEEAGTEPFDYENFTYDRNGNRKKLVQNGDEYIYIYGERNRLKRINLKESRTATAVLYAEYSYDENGNTTSRTIYGEEGIEIVEFEYDVLNRLVKTIRGSEWSEYFYDNAGNRVIKTTSGGSLDLYLKHGTIAVAMDIEVYGDQSTEKGEINRYILSGDLVAGRVTTTVNADDSETVEKNYYHLDHLNSTKVVTDEDGEVVVNYTYRAFGEQLKRLDSSNNETDDLGKYSYGGKELDEDINLYYFNARFYDATTGRFINVDPIQDGTNWYVYCSNNPMSMVDPTGLDDLKIEYNRVEESADWTFVPRTQSGGINESGIQRGSIDADNNVRTDVMGTGVDSKTGAPTVRDSPSLRTMNSGEAYFGATFPEGTWNIKRFEDRKSGEFGPTVVINASQVVSTRSADGSRNGLTLDRYYQFHGGDDKGNITGNNNVHANTAGCVRGDNAGIRALAPMIQQVKTTGGSGTFSAGEKVFKQDGQGRVRGL